MQTPLNDSSFQSMSPTEELSLIQRIPPPPPPLENLYTSSNQNKQKKKNDKGLKKTFSTMDVRKPFIQKTKEVPNQLQRSFKVFVIKQNIRKLINNLKDRVQSFSRFNIHHYQALNDKASDESVVTSKRLQRIRLETIKTAVKRKRTASIPGTAALKTFFALWLVQVISLLQPLKNCLKYVFVDFFVRYIPVIQPESQVARLINSLTVLIQGFYIVIIPVDIGFGVNSLSGQLLPINMLFQALFAIIMMLNFTKASFIDGQLVDVKSDIVSRYFFGNFLRDFVSLAAIFFSSVLQYQNFSQFLNFMMVLFYLQVGPLLESEDSYSKKDISQNKILRYSMKFVSLLLRILFAEHIFSCLFYFTSRQAHDLYSGTVSFINTYGIESAPLYYQYITTFYFASTTMITVGYGDLSPQNTAERIVVVIFQIVSSIQLSYSVNTIGNIIQEIKVETEKNQQKTRLINEYMETKNISSQLQLQIREYLNYYWREQEGEKHIADQQEIVNALPEHLKSKLLKEANEHIIHECPLFKKFRFSTPLKRELYRIIYALNLLPESILENEKSKANIKGPCIYYIEKGSISYQAPSGAIYTDIEIYQSMNYFGFSEFLSGEETQKLYKSTQFSRLFCLPLNEFLEILKEYPEDGEVYFDMRCQLELSPQNVLKQLPFQCTACKENNHNLTNCSLVHFVADRELVVKRHTIEIQQSRAPWKRGRNKTINDPRFYTVSDQWLVQEDAVQFEQDNSNFLNFLYEQPSDDYSESDSDDSDTNTAGASATKIKDDDSAHTSKTKRGLIEIKEEEENSEKEDDKSMKNTAIPSETGSAKNRRLVRYGTKVKTIQTFTKKPATKSVKKKTYTPKKPTKELRVMKHLLNSLEKNQNQEETKKKQLKFPQDNNQNDKQDKRAEQLEKIYSDEKMYLTMIERHKFMYQDKMNHFLRREDLWQLDTLHTILRVLLNPTNNEGFEIANKFSIFDPQYNKEKVISALSYQMVRVKSIQKLELPINVALYPGKKVLNLMRYMFYPYLYILRYKMPIYKRVDDERVLTDFSGSVNGGSPKMKNKQALSKSKVVPFP